MEITFKSRERKLKDINDIADYYRKTKTTQRMNLIISVLYNLLILLFIIGTIMSVIRSGSIGALFGDQRDLQRRFDCVSGTTTDLVKNYDEAHAFVQMYGGTCKLSHTNGG